jgi:hypothetical protein
MVNGKSGDAERNSRSVIRIGILGAGGLGKAAAAILSKKEEMRLVAICDRGGVLHTEEGIESERVVNLSSGSFVGELPGGRADRDPIGRMVDIAKDGGYDGLFLALPNLPNEFFPSVIARFIDAGIGIAYADALKRTRAAQLMFSLNERMREIKGTYLLGCGATPGLLTAAAVIAAQSFMKVERVKIWWGVGVSNWDAYRATVREDIAHLPGYDVEKAKALTDSQVEELLDKRDGKLILNEMEHADDLLLERAGVVDSRDKVEVGGVLDTRSAKKPVTTKMTITGTTFQGLRSSHTFTLGDETSMAANVVGPALGYLKRAVWLRDNGIYGIFGSTEHMPMIAK